MSALEHFRPKLESLKKQMLEDLWYTEILAGHGEDVIQNKTLYVKILILLLILNPLAFAYAIIELHLRTDWSIFPTDELRLHVILTTLYILFMLGACGLLYVHLHVFMYLIIYIKIEMELLTKYFEEMSSKCSSSNVNALLKDVHNLLVDGIKIHLKLLRYVL